MIDKRIVIGLFILSLVPGLSAFIQNESFLTIASIIIIDFLFLVFVYLILYYSWMILSKLGGFIRGKH